MNRKQLKQKQHAMTAVLVVALIAAAGVAQSAQLADPEFKRLDSNRDGTLSREEARKVRDFDKAFTEADENRDGKLDAAEYIKAQSIHERAVAGRFIDDSVITARVKAALLKDPVVSALAVSVETHKGTVVLSGFVENEGQQRRAAEVAATVQGVVTVKNGIVVKS
jgi:hyperosmotically inducible periplasmic protein